MTFTALLAALATVLQSAGGFLPGIGYFFSPIASLPIFLAALISLRSGLLAYVLTIFLLLLIQPSELVIFPFTTGLLGLGLGWTFLAFHRRLAILIVNSSLLLIGICIPLYGLDFPVFGPAVSSSINIPILLALFGFSLLYSWFWVEFSLLFLRKIRVILKLL